MHLCSKYILHLKQQICTRPSVHLSVCLAHIVRGFYFSSSAANHEACLTSCTPSLQMLRRTGAFLVLERMFGQVHVSTTSMYDLCVIRGGYNYNSTSIRRPFDCMLILSKIIKVTVSHGWQPGSNTGWLGESPTT